LGEQGELGADRLGRFEDLQATSLIDPPCIEQRADRRHQYGETPESDASLTGRGGSADRSDAVLEIGRHGRWQVTLPARPEHERGDDTSGDDAASHGRTESSSCWRASSSGAGSDELPAPLPVRLSTSLPRRVSGPVNAASARMVTTTTARTAPATISAVFG
jgi:hypothetical protein